ncbi:S-layer homology domain-containing protein [Paenibacillus massiliensis]|uniref:S-layer homology domain-containing protein n=1 Tax=Paenibacillus massiliensis TaxID=225917 RepID=UPI000472C748|nr:S-layer homology domain-containing protein [Paenibacillus massiliensis]
MFTSHKRNTRWGATIICSLAATLIWSGIAAPTTTAIAATSSVQAVTSLEDGLYTISAQAIKENSDEVSMSNALISRTVLQIKNGQPSAILLLQGNAYIPLKEVKGLWYQDATGSFKEIPLLFNESTNSIEAVVPLQSIEKPQSMQVSVPFIMGEEKPKFRLSLDTTSLQTKAATTEKTNEKASEASNAAATVETGKGAIKETAGENAKENVKETSKEPPVATSPQVFSDMQGHWAQKEVAVVTSLGLFNGTDATHFSPEQSVTRGMLATVLGRHAGVESASALASSFTDVPAGKYYTSYVSWAAERGLVKGTGQGLFAPERPVTREEAAVIIAAYIKDTGISLAAQAEGQTRPVYQDDSEISSWATTQVQQLLQAGIMTSKDDQHFAPKTPATRAEIASMLTKGLNLDSTGKQE